MKKFIVTILALLPAMGFSKSRESIPEWTVGAQVKDPQLKANESVFEMHFELLYTIYEDGDSVAPPPRIVYAWNGKVDSMDFPVNGKADLRIKPGKYVGQFYAGPYYFEVKTDSITVDGGYRRPVNINFKGAIRPIMEDKPVIYVYSDQPTQVNLQLTLKGTMGFTYPAYNNGWNFIADKEGNLYMNGKTYPYLFWEAQTQLDNSSIEWNEGFLVKRDSLIPFFEHTLTAMGLNQKEITDYITYWAPRMSMQDSCYIHFMLNEDYDEYATMHMSPAPDSKFQVFMIWAPATGIKSSDLTPQMLVPFQRSGLTVVEWGGTELPEIPVIFQDITY